MQNNQHDTPGHPLAAVYCQVSDTIRSVSDYIVANPGVTPKDVQDFNEQLVAIFTSVDDLGEASQRLDYAKSILERKLQSAPVNNDGNQPVPIVNAFGQIVHSFDALLQ